MNFKAKESHKGPIRVLVVGASGRMTAALLSRLGFVCSVADLFADRDTRMICDGRVTRLSRLKDLQLHEGLVRENDLVVFSGGLEGNVELAEKVSQWTGIAFTSPESIKKVNECATLNEVLNKSGLGRYPFERNPLKVTFPAIAKSLKGSGRALPVRHWLDCARSVWRRRVFQKVISGEPVSQVYVGDGQTAKLLGGTIQVGRMSWIGSISGLKLSEDDQAAAIQLSSNLVELTGIEGVFGIDFIRNEEGLWPIDFNPRIPASAELVGGHVMSEHMNSFGVDVAAEEAKPVDGVRGKLIVFNTSSNPLRFKMNRIPSWPLRHESSDLETSIADIPADGEVIKSGRPILTVFVCGKSEEEVQTSLREKSCEIQARLCTYI